MKKILLGTSAILGALTLVASSASAQTAAMMKDQKPGMKGSVGGTVGVNLAGGAGQKVGVSLPSWRNYISVKADGQASALDLTYGAYLRYRPFDGDAGADKAYVYMGQKYFGKISMGRNNSTLSDNLISPTDIVPGYSVDGDAATGGVYASVYDITQRAKPMGISYVTPSLWGVKIGYTYSSPAGAEGSAGNPDVKDFNGKKLRNTHDVFARYDGAFGPVTLGVMGGYRASGIANANLDVDTTGKSNGFVAGLQLGYTDGKNIGVNLAGNYTSANSEDSKSKHSASGWGVALAFDTPRVAGLTLGLMYASGSNSKDAAEGATLKNSQFAVGLGYAWSENFSQTFGYDMVLGASDNNKTTNTSSWVLSSQVSF